MAKLRKNDEVIVLMGRDKGKRGRIRRVTPDGKVIVDGVNLVKRHTKGNPTRGVAGGILEKEMPIQCSNVAIVNPQTGKADRVGFKFLEDSRKVRVFKSDGEIVDS